MAGYKAPTPAFLQFSKTGMEARVAIRIALMGLGAIGRAIARTFAGAGAVKRVEVSTDGGRTWKSLAPILDGYRSSVAFIPATKTAVVVGPTRCDASISDVFALGSAGSGWRQIGKEGYHSISFAREYVGWAVGANGRIARFDTMSK